MDFAEVMRLAIAPFAPSKANEDEAINAAILAGERLITGLGLGSANITKDELRKAAYGVWQLYYETSLEVPFEVTSVRRRDLLKIGATEEQVRQFTDKDMEAIANNMEESYEGSGDFWPDLGFTTNNLLRAKKLAEIHFADYPEEEKE